MADQDRSMSFVAPNKPIAIGNNQSEAPKNNVVQPVPKDREPLFFSFCVSRSSR